MRILLDENLPRRLTRLFGAEAQVTTVGRRGWSGKRNGELLELAEKEFDVFLTTDKGIPHQQNLSGLDLTIILLRAKSNDYEDLSPLMDEVNDALSSIAPGTFLQRQSKLLTQMRSCKNEFLFRRPSPKDRRRRGENQGSLTQS